MSDQARNLAKFKSVLTAKSILEKDILKDLRKIREVCEQRSRVFEEFKKEENTLVEQIKSLNSEHKIPALLKGQVQSAASAQAMSQAITEKLDLCRRKLENAYAELQQATLREEQTQAKLTEVKIEKKQIEKIIENQNFLSEQILQVSEEISIEELSRKK